MAAKKTQSVEEMLDLHDEVRRLTQERLDLKQQIVGLMNDNLRLSNQEADWHIERATLRQQVANLTKDRDAQEQRLMWVRLLTDGSQKRPRDLGDGPNGYPVSR